jgi:hypothetical protein
MSIYNIIPEKIITKAPQALGWMAQALFAAALPEVYEKMPKQMVITYLGVTAESVTRLKYIIPALTATVACYIQQKAPKLSISPLLKQQALKCCMGN